MPKAVRAKKLKISGLLPQIVHSKGIIIWKAESLKPATPTGEHFELLGNILDKNLHYCILQFVANHTPLTVHNGENKGVTHICDRL